jgi:hypothetical protein
MAAATPSIGLAHVTVVPTNFVPPREDDDSPAADEPATAS